MLSLYLRTILRDNFEKYVKEQVDLYINGYGDVEKENVYEHLQKITEESFDTFLENMESILDESLDTIRFEIDGIIDFGDLQLEDDEDLKDLFELDTLAKKCWTLDNYIEKLEENKNIKDRSDEIEFKDNEYEEQEWSKMDEDFI